MAILHLRVLPNYFLVFDRCKTFLVMRSSYQPWVTCLKLWDGVQTSESFLCSIVLLYCYFWKLFKEEDFVKTCPGLLHNPKVLIHCHLSDMVPIGWFRKILLKSVTINPVMTFVVCITTIVPLLDRQSY